MSNLHGVFMSIMSFETAHHTGGIRGSPWNGTRKNMNESEVVFVAVFGQLSPENVIEPRKTMEKLTNKRESEMGIDPIIGSMSQQNIWI